MTTGTVLALLASGVATPSPMTPWPEAATERHAQAYDCQPRRTCSQIGSCAEASWRLQNCPWGGRLDKDGDGVPCESLC